jgi:hypothetical protein
MSNQEYSRQPDSDGSVATAHETDYSDETLSQLVPSKLLAIYPDAKVEVIQPTRAGKVLTILISSDSAKLEPVSLSKSLLAAHEQGLLYCRMEFLSLKGETTNTVVYIPKHDDRPEIRHKGINAEFYEKLYAYLKSQGVRYVFGLNKLNQTGTHSHFFLETLGRSTFDDLSAEFAAKLPERFLLFRSVLTVQFL